MVEQSTLVTVASLIGGFGVAVLVFRIQREITMNAERKLTWIPWADYLVLSAMLLSLLLGVFPAVSGLLQPEVIAALGMASSSAAVLLLAGYPLAILAHYRLLLGRGRTGDRHNPEPAEGWIVGLTALSAAIIFGIVACRSFGV